MDRLPYEAKVPIWQRVHYVPTALQRPFHLSTNPQDFASGGWRSGKSAVLAAEALPHCLVPSPRPYIGAFIGPTYMEPREEMGYVRDWLAGLLPRRQFDPDKNVSWPKEGRVEISIPKQKLDNEEWVHFATLRSYTAEEAVRIRAFNADFVVICEAGGIDEEALFNILGRVLSTGGFIIGSGTLEKAQKWYHNMIREGLGGVSPRGIQSFILPSWGNTVEFPGGRTDPKILRLERLLPPDVFRTRVGGEPIRMTGVAVKEANVGHIAEVDVENFLPVELAIDPGYTGAYAVLAIQYYDGQVRIVDEVYERFKSTPEVVEECKKRSWWNLVDPSDPGVIDRAAKQHRDTDGMSVLEKWSEETGMWMDLTEAVIGISTGLEQLRIHLNKPGRILVSPRCRGLLGEWDLGSFPEGFEGDEPWHYTAGPAGNLLGDEKLRGANHSSTALIYWLVHRFGFVSEQHDFGHSPLVPMHDEYGTVGGLDILGREVASAV